MDVDIPDTLPATVLKGPLNTKGYWIAYPPIDTDKLIANLKELSCSWVALRISENVLLPNTIKLIESLKNNFKVFVWKYCLPDNADVTAKTYMQLEALQCLDGYIIDAEAEFNSKREAAKTLVGRIREVVGNSWLAHAPFALPIWHDTFPYAEFAAVCDAVMPQLYAWEFSDNGYKYWIPKYEEQWLKFELNFPEAKKPRYPIGCSYRPLTRILGGVVTKLLPIDPQLVAKDVSDYHEYFTGGLYTYEAMSPETYAAMIKANL